LFQKDVAATLKVGEDTVTYWENNRAKPVIHHLPGIIKFLGYNPLLIERETLGGKIKYYRYVNGLSHKAMGKLMKVDASTVGSWESNKSVPKFSMFNQLELLIQNH
jgi:DNA-binding transcriptional regulator YiaG